MILGKVLLIDCIVFLVFLAPQLLINVGIWSTLACAIRALPFLLLELPFSFVYDRYLTRSEHRNPFVREATVFEDFVLRCVRYAFAKIPTGILRVFLSKEVALPFLRFRMLRHGYFKSPIHWEEVSKENVKGIWMIHNPSAKPDIVIYYAHGGGFSLGSPYFYLEPLLTLLSHLKHLNPTLNHAIFALQYTLAPQATFPTQIDEAQAGYNHLLTITSNDPSKICLAGDSAGGNIMLSLLLHLCDEKMPLPAMITLISPWITLQDQLDIGVKYRGPDYLNIKSLDQYASTYAPQNIDDPYASPGLAHPSIWIKASPTKGYLIIYGASEVLAPSIRDFVDVLRKLETQIENGKKGVGKKGGKSGKVKGERRFVEVLEERGRREVHAWAIASLFLSDTREDRMRGLREIAESITARML